MTGRVAGQVAEAEEPLPHSGLSQRQAVVERQVRAILAVQATPTTFPIAMLAAAEEQDQVAPTGPLVATAVARADRAFLSPFRARQCFTRAVEVERTTLRAVSEVGARQAMPPTAALARRVLGVAGEELATAPEPAAQAGPAS
jgi:hypothetical protein